jgi:hypothetical protein
MIMEYRAYDTVTEKSGPIRQTRQQAEIDSRDHNDGCAAQGGYGSAEVVTRDPEAVGRLVDLDGHEIWPPYGHTAGTARWL